MASASDKSSGDYSVISQNDASKQAETGFRHAREDGVEVFYWVDRGFGYALSGNVEKAEMGRLADIAYHQISN